jgi:hypothetical protein
LPISPAVSRLFLAISSSERTTRRAPASADALSMAMRTTRSTMLCSNEKGGRMTAYRAPDSARTG